MGEIIQFKPRQGKKEKTTPSKQERGIIIPSLDALYDENQIIFGSMTITELRFNLSDSPLGTQAIDILEDRLFVARAMYISETIKPINKRKKALLELAKHTYSVALDIKNDNLQSISRKMIASAGSMRRAGVIIENIKIKKGIKPNS